MSAPAAQRSTSTGDRLPRPGVSIVVGASSPRPTGATSSAPATSSTLLTATSILGFIAIGQTLVILVGSLDLSVPFVISLASVIGRRDHGRPDRQHRRPRCSPRSASPPSSGWPTA